MNNSKAKIFSSNFNIHTQPNRRLIIQVITAITGFPVRITGTNNTIHLKSTQERERETETERQRQRNKEKQRDIFAAIASSEQSDET